MEKTDNVKSNTTSVVIKINNEIINANDVNLSTKEIELLKRILFNGKAHLCQSCVATVCLANKEKLSGPIFEGFIAGNEEIITRCANHRMAN